MTEHHTAPQSGLEPSRVVEVERKYDVDDATPLPAVSYTHLTLPTSDLV